MTNDSIQRGTREKKESYILEIVQGEGKIKATDLYGAYSRRFGGTAIRTFLNEYLPALEYRHDIVLHVTAEGFFVYHPPVFEKEQSAAQIAKGKISR